MCLEYGEFWDAEGVMREGRCREGQCGIASVHQAILARRRQPHTLAQAQQASSERNRKINFMGSFALLYYDKQTGKVEHGISCAGCQLALEKYIVGTRGEK